MSESLIPPKFTRSISDRTTGLLHQTLHEAITSVLGNLSAYPVEARSQMGTKGMILSGRCPPKPVHMEFHDAVSNNKKTGFLHHALDGTSHTFFAMTAMTEMANRYLDP